MDLFSQASVEQTPRLVKITLNNYRNISYREVLISDKGVILQGQNGIGKTNIIEAVYYVLSGKMFSGASQSDVQDVMPRGADQNTKTSVKLFFEKNNFTFELITYKQFKKNGEYKGMAYDYFVNEAPLNKGQAIEILYEYLGIKHLTDSWSKDTELKNIELIGLLFNINYLKDIDYKYLRALVVDVVGDIGIEDVIKLNPEKYASLKIELDNFNGDLERVKNVFRNEKFGKGVESGLDSKIETAKSKVADLINKSNQTYDKTEVDSAKKEVQNIENKIIDLKVKKQKESSDLTSQIDLEISKLETLKLQEEQKIREAHTKLIESLKDVSIEKDIESKKKTIQELEQKRVLVISKAVDFNESTRTLNFNITNKKNRMAELSVKRGELAKDWKATKNPESETLTCPHCNKPFHLHETKEHAQITTNKLKTIETLGISIKNELDNLKNEIEPLETQLEEVQEKIIKAQKEREQIDKNIEQAKKELSDLYETQSKNALNVPILDLNSKEVLSIVDKIQTLKNERNQVVANYNEVIIGIENQIRELETSKEPYQETIKTEIIVEQYKKDLQTYNNDLVKYQNRLEEVEHILRLVTSIEKDKYTLVEEKASKAFGENIKFELFKQNLDGTFDTRVCVMLVKDVHGNYVRVENLNTGLYPIRAIEFINGIREFYNIPKSFIFVDELSALDTKHTQQLMGSGLQIVATRPSDSQKLEEIKII